MGKEARNLLYLGAKDVRGLPLVERKALLARLVHRAADSRLRLSESFDDGAKLLAAAEKMGLEGVVLGTRPASKGSCRRDSASLDGSSFVRRRAIRFSISRTTGLVREMSDGGTTS